jgi:hypothetical protein
MKRHNDGDWYDIVQTPDPTRNGVWVRAYRIKCRTCGRENSHRASGMSDQHLRKTFQRHGWKVGSRKTHHFCHECCNDKRPLRELAATAASPPAADNIVPFPVERPNISCLFCYRSAEQVKLKSSAAASICYECVEVFSLEIAEEKFRNGKGPKLRVVQPPRITTPPVLSREEADAFLAAVKAEALPKTELCNEIVTEYELSAARHNWHSGSHIDRMPKEDNAPAPAHSQIVNRGESGPACPKPAPATPPPPEPSLSESANDEGADWYRELMARPPRSKKLQRKRK